MLMTFPSDRNFPPSAFEAITVAAVMTRPPVSAAWNTVYVISIGYALGTAKAKLPAVAIRTNPASPWELSLGV